MDTPLHSVLDRVVVHLTFPDKPVAGLDETLILAVIVIVTMAVAVARVWAVAVSWLMMVLILGLVEVLVHFRYTFITVVRNIYKDSEKNKVVYFLLLDRDPTN